MDNIIKPKDEWHFKSGEKLPNLEAGNYTIKYIKCNVNSFTDFFLWIWYRQGNALKRMSFNPIDLKNLTYPFPNNLNEGIAHSPLNLIGYYDLKFEVQLIGNNEEYDFVIGYSKT